MAWIENKRQPPAQAGVCTPSRQGARTGLEELYNTNPPFRAALGRPLNSIQTPTMSGESDNERELLWIWEAWGIVPDIRFGGPTILLRITSER
jgi:hypothetical protein